MTTQGYRIEIDEVDGVVTALRGETRIAASSATRVLRETRLPDCYYFPKSSVDQSLLVPSDKRTFCPFKGTATYWHVKTPSGLVENGAWCYETPLTEAAKVGGYLAFASVAVDRYSFVPAIRPSVSDAGHINSALSDWILREAGHFETRRELIGSLGRKLVETGMELYRLNAIIWSLHPEVAGASYSWSRDSDTVTVTEPGHDLFSEPRYLNSPVRYVAQGLGGVRQPLETDLLEFDFPIIRDLKAQGATDYVAMPIRFSNGQFNVMTLASDKPGGFSTGSLGLVFECSGAISRYLEVLTLRRNTETLLDTYLGRRTGQRVLRGEIRRGQGHDIKAVILFSDLRNSTGLAEQMPRSEYLQLLNRYYDIVLDPVEKYGGEVLKFIGDAVLAVFPIASDGKDQRKQAHAAHSAAREAASQIRALKESELKSDQLQLDLGIALHVGDVTYGNVGSHNRLDFTVIGPAVNLASRIENLCKTTGNTVLLSSDLAEIVEGTDFNEENVGLRSIGHHRFPGFAGEQEVYASIIPEPVPAE